MDDILTLSKLDSRLLEVTPTEVDPVETVKHALRLYQQECQNTDVASSIRVDQTYDDLDVDRVNLDPSRLLQVLINLLGNAIKFTQHQEQRMITVTIGASLESPATNGGEDEYFFPRASKEEPVYGADWGTGEDLFIHFSVSDTGCGLTSAEMKNLFLRFSQASPKTHVTYGVSPATRSGEKRKSTDTFLGIGTWSFHLQRACRTPGWTYWCFLSARKRQ